MNKFSDGFSDSSYEDLLNEYAGESLGSKVNRRSEPLKKEAPAKKSEPQKRSFEPPKRRAPEPVKKKAPEQPVRTAKPISKRSSDFSLDLNTIKSFDEEMAEKARKNDNDIFSHSEDIFSHSDRTPPAPPVIEKRFNAPRRAAKKPVKFKKAENASSDEPAPKKKLNAKEIGIIMKNAFIANKKAFLIFACCFVAAIALSSFAISCINDIFAINRDSEESVEVVLPNDADTDTAVEALHDAGLIKNQFFCKTFIKFKEKSEKQKPYLPGVYYFTENMGVEKMISRFKTSSVRGATISVTIPEGYTIDQIFDRLEKNGICTSAALYKTIDSVDFGPEYDFIKKLDNKQARYHQLEGYMFPATYEFEQGADPADVIRKFLNAFDKRWTDEYQKRAEELSMSVDDVITLASIIEKEGNSPEQFADISSVLHNRLNLSGLYPTLECNSTNDYVEKTIKKRIPEQSKIDVYVKNYNTYQLEGLPAGAICNPGTAAIEAALNPKISKNYFFRHDDYGKIYLAENNKQHDANGVIVDRVNAQKK